MHDLFKNYFGHEVKIQLVRETMPVKECRIKTANDAYELVKNELSTLDREAFLVISLSTKNKVLGLNMISIGSLNANLVHPREVFKSAILLNASSIILLHNHPSGETEPSKDDIEITQRLVDAGKLLGINVVDHIVVGNTFYSFSENNLLKSN
jgi:DNA repair protein RadC